MWQVGCKASDAKMADGAHVQVLIPKNVLGGKKYMEG
jgi:hypothetical protein